MVTYLQRCWFFIRFRQVCLWRKYTICSSDCKIQVWNLAANKQNTLEIQDRQISASTNSQPISSWLTIACVISYSLIIMSPSAIIEKNCGSNTPLPILPLTTAWSTHFPGIGPWKYSSLPISWVDDESRHTAQGSGRNGWEFLGFRCKKIYRLQWGKNRL